jgi:signal peptidase I
MSSTQEAASRSAWISVWLKPRQTIEHIVASRPQYSVLLLASLGAISGFVAELVSHGFTSLLLDWRVLLGLAAAGAVAGILGVYVAAVVFKWIGRLMGGRASAAELRAVLAWCALPSILGLIIVLVSLVALRILGGESEAAPNWLSLLLRVIVVLCGLWSVIVLLLMLARVQGFAFWRTVATYVLGGLIFPTLIALVIRTLLFQPFDIPSHSMAPTLLEGDYLFVSKFAYGYTHYSIPFSPRLFSGRIFGSEPARGDLVVFRLPKDGTTDYVKRVVGLPGDRVQMKQGLLYINDTPVRRERLADFVGGDNCGTDPAAGVKRWREILPDGVSYETLDCVDNGFYDNTSVFTVPPGQFFTIGDNRDNSTDSRVLSAVGYVPLENFIGRVVMIFYSSAAGPAGTGPVVRSERIGMFVH